MDEPVSPNVLPDRVLMPGFAELSDPMGGLCFAKASQVKSVAWKTYSRDSSGPRVTLIGFKSGGFLECLESPEEAFLRLEEARIEDYAECEEQRRLYVECFGARPEVG